MQFLQNVNVTRGLVVFIQWWMWFGQTIIILMAGMTSIPISLYEAAMVDGATRFEAFYKVALPVAVPGLVSIGLIAFTWTWNELLFALTLISNEEFRTLPVGLSMFALKFGVIIHYILAGSFIFLVPPLIIFVLAQKYIVQGLAAGAVKG